MKPTHTPGPWRINKYQGIGAGEFGILPVIIDASGWMDGTEADRRLIAASPDLLSALIETAESLQVHVDTERGRRLRTEAEPCPCEAALSHAHAAIRKATEKEETK